MLILALDASTPTIAVGLARAEDERRRMLAEISVSARGASKALLPAIHAVLDLAGEEIGSVDRILTGTGPGTFTGIRIAAATARSLSLGTGTALSANSTLAALASPALPVAGDVLAVVDARRGQVFVQRFTHEGPAGEISCVRPEDLSVGGGLLMIGDGAVRYREVLSRHGDIPPDDSPLHRVSAAGHVLSADLTVVDAVDLVPTYVREPDAEVRRDLNPWSRR